MLFTYGFIFLVASLLFLPLTIFISIRKSKWNLQIAIIHTSVFLISIGMLLFGRNNRAPIGFVLGMVLLVLGIIIFSFSLIYLLTGIFGKQNKEFGIKLLIGSIIIIMVSIIMIGNPTISSNDVVHNMGKFNFFNIRSILQATYVGNSSLLFYHWILLVLLLSLIIIGRNKPDTYKLIVVGFVIIIMLILSYNILFIPAFT